MPMGPDSLVGLLILFVAAVAPVWVPAIAGGMFLGRHERQCLGRCGNWFVGRSSMFWLDGLDYPGVGRRNPVEHFRSLGPGHSTQRGGYGCHFGLVKPQASRLALPF